MFQYEGSIQDGWDHREVDHGNLCVANYLQTFAKWAELQRIQNLKIVALW